MQKELDHLRGDGRLVPQSPVGDVEGDDLVQTVDAKGRKTWTRAEDAPGMTPATDPLSPEGRLAADLKAGRIVGRAPGISA